MKAKALLICLLLVFPWGVFSQGYWTQKADFGGTPKYWAVGFSINGKGYAGLGRGDGFSNSSDMWEYDPVLNTWTQKASFPGGARYSSHVFVLNNKAYFCSGAYWTGISGDYSPYNDVWEYNPATDTWLQKNNFPGPGRHDAFAFSYGGFGFLCLGQDDFQDRLSDLWRYNPNNDTWVQKATFPGTARSGGIQFGFQKYGYVGLGRDDNEVSLGDIWSYDASTDIWTQKANFPAASRTSSSTFVTDSRAYIVCGYNFQTSSYPHELWEYNPINDTWIQREDFPPGDRACGSTFSINNIGYFGLGNVFSSFYKDFWEYTPSGTDIENFYQNEPQVLIFPNPSQDNITIETSDITKQQTISIYNMHGQLLMQQAMQQPKTEIDISRLAKGVYVIKLGSSDGVAVRKFIVR